MINKSKVSPLKVDHQMSIKHFKAVNNILIAFRKNKLDAIIDEHVAKEDQRIYKPSDPLDGMNDKQRRFYKKSYCLLRNGDRIKTKWDLVIMLLSIWN
jgi:hypothetical protein